MLKEIMLELILQKNQFTVNRKVYSTRKEMEDYIRLCGNKPWFELMNLINKEQFVQDIQRTFKISLPDNILAKWNTFAQAVAYMQKVTGQP